MDKQPSLGDIVKVLDQMKATMEEVHRTVEQVFTSAFLESKKIHIVDDPNYPEMYAVVRNTDYEKQLHFSTDKGVWFVNQSSHTVTVRIPAAPFSVEYQCDLEPGQQEELPLSGVTGVFGYWISPSGGGAGPKIIVDDP